LWFCLFPVSFIFLSFFPIQLFIFSLFQLKPILTLKQVYHSPCPSHISFTFFLMFLYLCYISLNNKPLLSINSFLCYFEGSNIILYHGSNMLTVYAPRAILNFRLYQDSPSTQQTYYSYKINNVNFINFNPAFPKPYGSPCSNIFLSSSFSWNCEKRHKSHHHIFHHKCLVIKHAMLPQFFIYFGSFNLFVSLFFWWLIRFWHDIYCSSVDHMTQCHLMMSTVLHAT